MRPLTIKEQEKHVQLLDKFVKKIEERILSQQPFSEYEIHLKEVGYGIKVDDQYVYFDFPFNENVPVLNNKLSYDPYLKDVDNSIHQRYFQHQKNCMENCEYDGYIYYKYYFDEKSQKYHLFQHSNNLGIEESDENYHKFLPVMDCAVSPERTTYKNTVKIKDDYPSNVEIKEILVLSKRVGKEDVADSQKPVYTDDDNMLLCTFELKAKNDSNFSSIAERLYDDVFFFLESYFHSPILEKIMLDKRKSYILGYKHNLGKLKPELNIENIRKYIEVESYRNIENELSTLEQIIKVFKFTHKLMFDYEFVQAGFSTYDILFRNRSISQIIEYFNIHFSSHSLVDIDMKFSADYTPVFNDKEGDFELFDYVLILWNIWTNCQYYHSGMDRIEICMEDDNFGNKFFKIINSGEMTPSMVKYINDPNKSYPSMPNRSNNPYPGLMIVKDLVANNQRLSIKAFTESGRTILQLIIKK